MISVSGRSIAAALKGHWAWGRGKCRCPAHDDSSPSLSVHDMPDSRVLVHCFAGCSQDRVIEALRARGLWPERDDFGRRLIRKHTPVPVHEHRRLDADERASIAEARAIWQRAKPLTPRSLSWLYFYSRQLPVARVPPSLRDVDALYSKERHDYLPALIGGVQDRDGKVTAVLRIWIQDRFLVDGGVSPKRGSRAELKVPKKTRGFIGDGAVSLKRAGPTLGIAEGIETGLVAQDLYHISVWVAIGAWRIGRIAVPNIVERVVIFGDNGAEGVTAAEKAEREYQAQSLSTDIVYPPAEYDDFADWLTAEQGERCRAA